MQWNEGIILVKIEALPLDIVLIQVYMLASAREEENVEKACEQIKELMVKENGRDNAVMGEG